MIGLDRVKAQHEADLRWPDPVQASKIAPFISTEKLAKIGRPYWHLAKNGDPNLIWALKNACSNKSDPGRKNSGLTQPFSNFILNEP